jgi:hypothetical protein
VVAAGGGELRGYDARGGARRWTQPLSRCQSMWTGETDVLVADACGTPTRLRVLDASTGAVRAGWDPPGTPTPWACRRGRSGCRFFQAGTAQWRVQPDGTVAAVPAARSREDFVLGTMLVVHKPDAFVAAVDLTTGQQLWVLPLSGYVIGADDRGVYAVTRRYTLQVYDPATGTVLRQLNLRGPDPRPWRVGHVLIHDGYVAVERLAGTPDQPDNRYFYGPQPVVLMAV